jgi:hypothetical protein
MIYLISLIVTLGVFEIASNIFHLSKKTKKLAGLSAKRQHRELSFDLGYIHFYIRAVIMLIFGVLFTLSGLTAILTGNTLFLSVVLALFALYGLVQALFYKHPYKVWMLLIVHTLPVISMFFLSEKSHGEAIEVLQKNLISGSSFVFPLTLSREPLNRLLVASFKGDAEYEGIEPQMFDDSITGRGLKILMYRKDKKVDVYWQTGIHFDAKTFKIGDGLGNISEVIMSPSRFEISEKGVDIDIAFTDKLGRPVKIVISENTKNIHPFPFLAPVGNDVKDPNKLFAVYMKEFDFVRREGTIIHVSIGDRELTPATFPISRDKQKVYLIRYASKLVIGEINSSVTKPSVIENVSPGIIKTGNLNLLFNSDNEVQSCWIGSDSDRIELKFETGFPNLLTLPTNKKIKGDWQYAVSDEVLFGGTYSLLRYDNKVNIELDVIRKWKPGNIPFSFKVFTSIVRSFRTWPASYRWNATVDLNGMSVESRWQRK